MDIVTDHRWQQMLLSRGDTDIERSTKVRDKFKQLQKKRASEEEKNEVFREQLVEAVTSGVMPLEEAQALAAQKGIQDFHV